MTGRPVQSVPSVDTDSFDCSNRIEINLHTKKGLKNLSFSMYTDKRNALNNLRITDCKIMKQTDLSCILSSL